MGRKEVLSRLVEFTEQNRGILGVIGAGTLGKNFFEDALEHNAGTIVLYNRTFDKALAIAQDKIQGIMGKEISFGERQVAEGPKKPGKVIADARIVRDEQTLIYKYGESKTGYPNYVVVTSDPRVVAAIAPRMRSVYYTLGRSEHQNGEVQIDRNLSLKDNIAIVSEMVPKLGLAHATNAVHIVTSNPDNVIVDAYQQITGLSDKQVAAVGVSVDSIRLAQTIADELDVSLSSIHNPVVVGNHGFDMVMASREIAVGDDNLINATREYLERFGSTEGPDIDGFLEEVRQKAAKAGGQILFGKSEGTAHGPAQMAVKLAQFYMSRSPLATNTIDEPGQIIATVRNPKGLNGVDEDVFLGNMVIIDKKGITPIEVDLTDAQRDALRESAIQIQETMNLPEVVDAISSARDRVVNTPRIELFESLESGPEFERPGGGRATG